MTSNFSGISSQPGIKALTTQENYAPSTKNTATSGAAAPAPNADLASWYEQAYAFYNGVMAGTEAKPANWDAPDGVLAQMQWAASQLGYSAPSGQAWNPAAAGPQGMPPQAGQQSNQFGGQTGTMDNWVYTNEKSEIGFTGDGTHDIWSNDTVIDVAPTSGHVTIENTFDSRFQPNAPVVKITVTDPATGTSAVYFVHDFDPATDTIKVNTPNSATQVQNLITDATISAKVTTGKFTGTGSGGAPAKPDASIPGVPSDTDPNTITYEPDYAGGTIDFFANPGENQTHIAYADSNISVKPSDNVTVSKPDPGTGPTDPNKGVITVVVTHSDGTTDTYKIQKGYKVNVNANAEYITFAGAPGTAGVPTDMADRITLNGGVADGGTSGASADAIVSGLLTATNPARSEAQLLSALHTAGYTYATIAALKQAITDKQWPPTNPDPKLVDFLRRFDGDLATGCNDLNALRSSGTDAQKKSKTAEVQTRLSTLLQTLYPDSIISEGAAGSFGGVLSINGTNVNWSLTTDGKLDMPDWVMPDFTLPDFHVDFPHF